MDSSADADFHKLFETFIEKVDFSGCTTPEDVNKRLLAKIKELKFESSSPNSDTENPGVE